MIDGLVGNLDRLSTYVAVAVPRVWGQINVGAWRGGAFDGEACPRR